MSSDSEDEDFAEYGTPLDPLDEGTKNNFFYKCMTLIMSIRVL